MSTNRAVHNMRGETMTVHSVKALQDIAEFDHPFIVTDAGTVEDAAGVYAPEVFNSEDTDIEIMGNGWEALTGYTGQYGYYGAVMHASEFIGGGLADDILVTPGIYVVVVVNVLSDYDGAAAAGWAVLRQVVES